MVWSQPGKKTPQDLTYLKTNSEKKGWVCGSNGRMLAYQVQGPEFKPLNCKKKSTHVYIYIYIYIYIYVYICI
jgi:hypothetical protein